MQQATDNPVEVYAVPKNFSGHGLVITWGLASTPVGICSLGWCAKGVCHLAFCPSTAPNAEDTRWMRLWPGGVFQRNDAQAQTKANAILRAARGLGKSPGVLLKGTEFQISVWRALLRIPAGAVCSYADIAGAVGRARAARAVGTACGANPVAVLVPCHRVVHANGDRRGYHWGDVIKNVLLDTERHATGKAN